MGAVTELGEEEDVARLAILAGSDIILDPRNPLNLIERLVGMTRTKEIPEPILDSVVEKIITVKRKWLNTQPYHEIIDDTYGQKLITEIAQRSVCCLKGGRLHSDKAMIYVLDVTQSQEDISIPFVNCLTEAGIDCQKITLTFRDAEEFLPENDSGGRAIICLIYTSFAAWKGHTNLPESFKMFLRRVSNLHAEKISISFGSPYVVRGLERFDTILCTFDHLHVCQRAVFDVLLGRLGVHGHLPVKLHLDQND
jgi:hypothetical protein